MIIIIIISNLHYFKKELMVGIRACITIIKMATLRTHTHTHTNTHIYVTWHENQ